MRVNALAVQGLGQAETTGGGWGDWLKQNVGGLLDKGTDVYAARLALEKAMAEGATAAQIQQMQLNLMAMQNDEEYKRQMSQRRFMLQAGAGAGVIGLIALALLARSKGKGKGKR